MIDYMHYRFNLCRRNNIWAKGARLNLIFERQANGHSFLQSFISCRLLYDKAHVAVLWGYYKKWPGEPEEWLTERLHGAVRQSEHGASCSFLWLCEGGKETHTHRSGDLSSALSIAVTGWHASPLKLILTDHLPCVLQSHLAHLPCWYPATALSMAKDAISFIGKWVAWMSQGSGA